MKWVPRLIAFLFIGLLGAVLCNLNVLLWTADHSGVPTVIYWAGGILLNLVSAFSLIALAAVAWELTDDVWGS